jgi:hypothetical protein
MTDETPGGETITPDGDAEDLEQFMSIQSLAVSLKTDSVSDELFKRKREPRYPLNWSEMTKTQMENYAYENGYVFCAGYVTPHHLRFRRGKGKWRPLKWVRKYEKCKEEKDLQIAELKTRMFQ